MARLPEPGKDAKKWGDILNQYLLVAHNTDGSLRPGVVDHKVLTSFAVSAGNIAAGNPQDGQVLVVDSTQPGGLAWKSLPQPSVASATTVTTSTSTASRTPTNRTGTMMAAMAVEYANITATSSEASIAPLISRNDASAANVGVMDVLAPNVANGQNVSMTYGRTKTTADAATFIFTPQADFNTATMALGMRSRGSIFVYDFRGNFTLGGDATIPTAVTLADRKNFVFSTGVGTKIGTSTTQKISFYGATPVAQPSGDVAVALSTLGLVANPTVNVNMASLTGIAALATRGGYEKVVITSSPTLDLNLGNIFEVTLSANATFVFNNPAPVGYASSFSLYVKQDATGGRTITWPSSVRWSGAAPTPTSTANSIDLYVFETYNGGAMWFGAQAGTNF